MLARVAGTLAIVLGFTAWSGVKAVQPIHMVLGLLLVVAVWGLAFKFLARNTGLAFAAVALGLAIPALGLTQSHVVIGGHHAIMRVLHMLAGLGGIGMAEAMYKRLKTSEVVLES